MVAYGSTQDERLPYGWLAVVVVALAAVVGVFVGIIGASIEIAIAMAAGYLVLVGLLLFAGGRMVRHFTPPGF